MLAAGVLPLWGSLAFGQIPDDIEPTPEPAAPVAWAQGHRWTTAGLLVGIQSLTISEDGVAFALDDQVQVWRQDRARSWTLVLERSLPTFDPEALLLDAELSADELIETEEEELDDDADDVIQLQEGSDLAVLDAEVRMGARVAAQPVAPGVVAQDGMVFVITDRLEGSTDGESFVEVRVPEPPRFIAVREGVWFLGTDSGIYQSQDQGHTWQGEIIGQVGQLEAGPGGVAAIIDGEARWRTPIGWVPVGLPSEATVLTAGPTGIWVLDVQQRLWHANGHGLAMVSDQGPALHELVSAGLPNHVVGRTQGGRIYEWRQGRWWGLSQGLESRVRALAGGGGRFLAGGRLGAARLVPWSGTRAPMVQVAPPLPEVLAVALNRHGLRTEVLAPARSLTAALLTPQLTFRGAYGRREQPLVDYLANQTSGATLHDWEAELQLCFGGCAQSEISSFASDYEVMTVGSAVYDLDDVGAYAPAANNVGQDLNRYRRQVSEMVARLYFARSDLQAELDAGSSNLADSVALQIDIDRLEARLDVYSDGYFTRVLDGSMGG